MRDFFKKLNFQRVTTQRYMSEIDGLRFLAIFPVLLLHFRTSFIENVGVYEYDRLSETERFFDSFILTGDVGVLIFFVISGFILALPFANFHLGKGKSIHLGRYFLKRLTRLEPPYMITLLLFLVVHIVIKTDSISQLWKHFGASLVYSHNWIYQTWSMINPVAWSLEIEIQFYVLVPLLSKVFAIRSVTLRRLVIVGGIVAFPVVQYLVQPPFMSLLGFGQYFLTGFLVADIFVVPLKRLPKPVLLDWIGGVAIILIFVLRYYKIRDLLPLVLFCVFMAALYGGVLSRMFKTRWVAIIGGMCYITYLIHYPVFIALVKTTKFFASGFSYFADLAMGAMMLIPIVLVISATAFLVLEKPFMHSDWPMNFYKGLRTVTVRLVGGGKRPSAPME